MRGSRPGFDTKIGSDPQRHRHLRHRSRTGRHLHKIHQTRLDNGSVGRLSNPVADRLPRSQLGWPRTSRLNRNAGTDTEPGLGAHVHARPGVNTADSAAATRYVQSRSMPAHAQGLPSTLTGLAPERALAWADSLCRKVVRLSETRWETRSALKSARVCTPSAHAPAGAVR